METVSSEKLALELNKVVGKEIECGHRKVDIKKHRDSNFSAF
jgi:hypothetical protein